MFLDYSSSVPTRNVSRMAVFAILWMIVVMPQMRRAVVSSIASYCLQSIDSFIHDS